MALGTNLDNSGVKTGWVSSQGGYEVTQSPGIIGKYLQILKTGKFGVTLTCKGYQSDRTVVFAHDEQYIFIDKPKDWTPDKDKFRVIFRNEVKVWMHFVATVSEVTEDALKCLRPRELFMLQRRSHYRVLLPRQSLVSCIFDQKPYEMQVKDLSAAGMLIFSQLAGSLPRHARTLHDLVLTVPCHDNIPGAEHGFLVIRIDKAEVVRSFVLRQHPMLFCFGLRFSLSGPEEEKVLRYVRQRELEGLRKGLLG